MGSRVAGSVAWLLSIVCYLYAVAHQPLTSRTQSADVDVTNQR
jgi:hypothetical protein